MRKKSRFLKIGLGILLVAFLLGLNGCTKYANEEELQALERQKQATLAAEAKIEDLKQEKSDLERQIATKKRELAEVQKTLGEIR